MARPPQISRSFPWLTLIMAVPLLAILAVVVFDRYLKGDGDGWKTYHSERFRYEIRYPPSWALERDDGGEAVPGLVTWYTSFIDRAVPTPGMSIARNRSNMPLFPTKAVAWVNPQGDWCLRRTTTTEITVGGVAGTEHVCYWYGMDADECEPQPGCREQPLGLMREFVRDGTKFWVFADVGPYGNANIAADYDTARRVVQSFRFVD